MFKKLKLSMLLITLFLVGCAFIDLPTGLLPVESIPIEVTPTPIEPTPIVPTPTPIEPTPIVPTPTPVDPTPVLDAIELYSNIPIQLEIKGLMPFELGYIYTIKAPEAEGYLFIHWVDLDTDLIISIDNEYMFLLNRNRRFEAVYIESGKQTLFVYSNIQASFTYAFEKPYTTHQEITITANFIEEHRFKHWLDAISDTILTTDSVLHLVMDQNFYLIAIYERHTGNDTYELPNVPLIFYVGEDLEIPNNSTRIEIFFDSSFQKAFSHQETWNIGGCVAIDIILGELDCQVQGMVDTHKLGEYSVTYYALDEDGYYASKVVTKVVLRDKALLDFTYSLYYDGIKGLYGESLIVALRTILNEGVTMQTYGDARYILNISDRDPNNFNNVILVYRGTSVSGTWDGGATWNREHVWPQSLLGVNTTNTSRHVGADLHNLKPANPSENSSRGNKYFGDATTTESYAPRNAVKGDVARILFYMILMYDYLELVNQTPLTHQMALFDLMIKWHFEDIPDGFEINRNNVIYTYQNNRNPLIDYPHLVELIFYDHQALIS